jgi:hypothetical protein
MNSGIRIGVKGIHDAKSGMADVSSICHCGSPLLYTMSRSLPPESARGTNQGVALGGFVAAFQATDHGVRPSSIGSSIDVSSDHSCREGFRCRMPDFYPPSAGALQPFEGHSRTGVGSYPATTGCGRIKPRVGSLHPPHCNVISHP